MSNELSAAEATVEKVVSGIRTTLVHGELILNTLHFPVDRSEANLKAASEHYADADKCLIELHRAWTYGEEQRLEFTKPLNEVFRRINLVFKDKLDPIRAMKDALCERMAAYARAELTWKRAEEDRIRKEEIRKREDEALKKAQDAISAGLGAKADAILEKPIIAPRINVQAATDEARSSHAVKWTARIVNKMVFLQAIIDGKIDSAFVDINEAALRTAAGVLKDKMKWPGVEVFEDVQIGSRR